MSLNKLRIHKAFCVQKSGRARLETSHGQDEYMFTMPLFHFSSGVLYFYVSDLVKM
jgi:hypothetical protein